MLDTKIMMDYFHTGETRKFATRVRALKHFKKVLKHHEAELLAALKSDLNKAPQEAYASEIGQVYAAINESIKYLKTNKDNRTEVKTPFVLFGAKSYIYDEPYGNTLIIAPWNYPIQLALIPLVAAIAAGNVAVVKPSELAPASEAALVHVLTTAFPAEYVQVFTGGIRETQGLLAKRWDFICFTGSTKIGRLVMKAAAEHLTPVLLELGGKSPVIVDESANLRLAAKRIANGKLINAGQTCIAPDYVVVHEKVAPKFLRLLADEFHKQWPQTQAEAPRIINERQYHRLSAYLADGTIYAGGQTDIQALTIEPTILVDVDWQAPVMEHEIFGPILPVLTYRDFGELLAHQQQLPQPLAFYFFSGKRRRVREVMQKMRFGNGAINDTVMQIINPNLPFGGMGPSGIGVYHGEASIKTFSHQKAVLHQSRLFDNHLRYHKNRFAYALIRQVYR